MGREAVTGKHSRPVMGVNEMATLFKTATMREAANKPQAGSIAWLNDCIERGRIAPFAEVTTLTPGVAAELLRRNPDNRSIRPVKLRHFVSDMKRGRWSLNGETIIISKDGLVNDGQHRCLALVEANTTIPVTIFFGADRETRKTVDQGSVRNASAFLAMDGVPNSVERASIARMVLAYEASDAESLYDSAAFNNSDIYDRALSDPSIAIAARFAASHHKQTKPYAAPSIIGFCLYEFMNIDEDEAQEYMGQVVTGENLRAKDPAKTVRDRLLAVGRRNNQDKVEIIFRGWNAFRQGRPLAIAKVMNGNLPELI